MRADVAQATPQDGGRRLNAVLALDRMSIEEAGPNPDRLAAAIHDQLGHESGEVPVAAIAMALDIVEIREAPLRGLEGALVTPADRNVGMIAINSASSKTRRLFTLAHELGHFLNPWHTPEDGSGFACSRSDIGTPWGRPPPAAARRAIQEAEASRFAIELLAPKRLARRYLHGLPDLARAIALSDELGLSRESAARRYVELHDESCALVFSSEGIVRYIERRSAFPWLSCQRGDRLPILPSVVDASGLSAHEEAIARDWVARPSRDALIVQTLTQSRGFAITLLAFEASDSEDDEGQ
ncbi:ImmA/IrrE family metallo-endopeptidase [Methylocella tundrae]|uniref:IrrE N-terminal-like domain-containing protein n=1 Tax=Methylocella tundrae TaxID=227605 RepID=A0A4U8YYW0_METTU|nr:ImmA/IrrE family metallo-endopeptidase [Methylocella tundrae]WPP06174.1 ImmA/IrrE family metallo-endopeptidase [Methylocella tundrae]VFU08806.1 conserved protein of unknown function [Methylocella tundrae]